MTKYDADEISALLKRNNRFVPAGLIIYELITRGKAKSYARSRILSQKTYETTEADIIECSDELMSKGFLICGSTPDEYSGSPYRIDRLFEELIGLTTKEMVFVSPFLSTNFISDIHQLLEPKKDILTIVTNSPASEIVNSKVQEAAIKRLKAAGFRVLVTERSFHAKIYLFDRRAAIMGSSNLSRQGFLKNYELGVIVLGEQCTAVARWVSEVLGFDPKRHH